jgi:hypothetical protein
MSNELRMNGKRQCSGERITGSRASCATSAAPSGLVQMLLCTLCFAFENKMLFQTNVMLLLQRSNYVLIHHTVFIGTSISNQCATIVAEK